MTNQPKKKLAARVYDAIFPPKQHKRTYAAAKVNRLNAGWPTSPTGANYERRVSLATLIARSRQAARDDLHIVNYLRLMRANVIGQNGIKLQAQAQRRNGKLNVPLNERVETAWWAWTHAETCTVSGKLDWKGIQDLAVTQCERDGAFLIEMIETDNAFGFALRTWDVTWLDETFNENKPGQNRIIMSVEVDDYDKPVAYWLTTPTSELMFAKSRTRRRVPAEQIIHGFKILDDESQVRGVPGTAAALLLAKNAYSYSESVVMASRVGANQFGVLKNTAPDGGEPAYSGQEDDEGSPQHPFIESSPLSITPLLPGWELQQFKPDHPTQNHQAFKETLDMDVAVALGVPYFLLMGNWKAVNFSSSRGGLGEFRERCKSEQNFYATTLCRRVYNAWLRSAWATGALQITPAEYLELQNPEWQARGFDYIDPEKDTKTDILRLQYGLAAPSEVQAERGKDYVDHLKKLQADDKLAATFGQDNKTLYAPPTSAPPPAPAGKDDDEGEIVDEKDDEETPPQRSLALPTNGNGHFVP